MQSPRNNSERYCMGECDKGDTDEVTYLNPTPHLEIDDGKGGVIIICDICGHTAESLKLSDDFYENQLP